MWMVITEMMVHGEDFPSEPRISECMVSQQPGETSYYLSVLLALFHLCEHNCSSTERHFSTVVLSPGCCTGTGLVSTSASVANSEYSNSAATVVISL